MKATLQERLPVLWNNRTELVQRLLADFCELCGSEEDVEVHHERAMRKLHRIARKAQTRMGEADDCFTAEDVGPVQKMPCSDRVWATDHVDADHSQRGQGQTKSQDRDTGEPCALKGACTVCAVRRVVVSLLQAGGMREDIPGLSVYLAEI